MKKILLPFVLIFTSSLTHACGILDTITLTILAAPEVTIDGPSEICENSDATLTVLESFQSYDWSTGSNLDITEINEGGTYTVTVTDSQGCVGEGSIQINELPLTSVNISESPYECDDQITLDAGDGFAMYEWSDGGGTDQLAVYNADGTYTVTVTDINGCTNTDNISITIPDDPIVNISGPIEFCSNESAILGTTDDFEAYSWSNGETTQNISINTADTYEVTVTDENGCTASSSLTVNLLIAPEPILEDGQVCPGDFFALNILNVPFDSYLWNTGATTPGISVPPGNYSVTVTDENGCTGTTSAQVTEFDVPNPTILIFGNICNGVVQLALDQPYDFVEWSTSETTQTINVTESDTYSVTVTNADGCEGTSDVVVDFSSDVNVNILGPTGICEGNITSLEAVSTNAINFEWSTGEITTAIDVSEPNTYTVTATDIDGCTNTATFELFEFDNPNPIITGPNQICEGSIATLGLTESYTTYEWNTNENTAQINIDTEGEYIVTVTNPSGCTASDTITITTSTNLSPSINILDLDCGIQATISAGNGYATYLWNTGEMTQEITVDENGSYSVTVTDNTGCSGSASEMVTIPEALNVTINGSESICENSETTLSLSESFDMVQWIGGSTADTLVVDTAGTYIVNVADENGCEATDTFMVSVVDALEPTIEGDDFICNGDTTMLTVIETYTDYTWSTGAETSSISASDGGLYEVTVADENGCTGSTTFQVDQLDELSPTIVISSADCDGIVILTTDIIYDAYQWSSSSEADSISVSQGGDYQVTVTDVNGCTGTAEIEVSIPNTPDLTILGATTFCAGSSTTLTSSIEAESYQWSTGSTEESIIVTTPGSVILIIEDLNGCAVSDTVDIVESDNLNPAIEGPTLFCNEEFIVLNSVNEYDSYLWSTGDTSESIETNVPDVYGLTVTDTNGCSGTNTYTVTASNIQAPTILNLAESCAEEAELTTSVSYASYLWSTGEDTESIIVTDPGIVTVEVMNEEGCTASDVFDVQFSEGDPISIAGELIQCDANETMLFVDGSFTDIVWSTGENSSSIILTESGIVTVEGTNMEGCTSSDTVEVLLLNEPDDILTYPTIGCLGEIVTAEIEGSFETVQWSNGDEGNTTSLVIPFTGSVTVINFEGCSYTYDIIIDAYTPTTPTIDLTPDCEASAELSLSDTYQSYSWSTGSTDASINIILPGFYDVTVVDDNNCSATASINVTEIPQELQVAIEGDNFLCEGEEGTLMIVGTYDIVSWFLEGELIATDVTQIPITSAGTYSVEVSIGNDCSADDSFEVSNATQQDITIVVDSQPCTNEPASLRIEGIDDEEIADIQWSNGNTSPEILVDIEDNYSVTVTTINGCILEASPVFVDFASTNATLFQVISCDEEEVGTETFFFTNAAGCDSIVTVVTELTETPEDYMIDLGEERLVSPGELVSLSVTSNFQILGLSYDSPYELSCDDCLDPAFIATTEGLITVTAFDSISCAASNSLRISLEDQDIVVPNIFRPTSELNGFFTITNNNPLITVNSLSIYDRWGNLVYFSQDENDISWDGTMNGQILTPGVYIYMIKYTHFENGEQLNAGDVTLIR